MSNYLTNLYFIFEIKYRLNCFFFLLFLFITFDINVIEAQLPSFDGQMIAPLINEHEVEWAVFLFFSNNVTL